MLTTCLVAQVTNEVGRVPPARGPRPGACHGTGPVSGS
jgi:hypothetical protein